MPPSPIFASNAPAEPASVPLLRREVVGFMVDNEVCAERTEDIRLAVSEALSNAVLHAYRSEDPPGDVQVSAARRDHCVEVVVRDSGRGMSPRSDSPGLGLGLPVIAEMTDCFEIEHLADMPGTAIRMRFDC